MPLDANKSSGDSGILDISQMSWSDILNNSGIPSSFKTKIMLQLQRSGQNGSVIAISDFARLSVDEEITKKRKETDEFLNKKLEFQEQKQIFLELLKEEREKVSDELDDINDAINNLSGKKEHTKDVDKLRDYRDDLRSYFKMLDWLSVKTAASTSMDGLKVLMQKFAAAGRVIYDNRDKLYTGLAATAYGAAKLAEFAGRGLSHAGRFVLSFRPF